MRNEEEIRSKLNQLLGRNLEKSFQKKLGKKPHNCVHNHVQSSLVNKNNKIEVEHTGICMLNSENPDAWEGRICETVADARFCPYFTARYDKQKVYEEFMSKVSDVDSLQHEFRDLFILQWVLGEVDYKLEFTLLQKVKFWFLGLWLKIAEWVKLRRSSKDEVTDLTEKLFSDSAENS